MLTKQDMCTIYKSWIRPTLVYGSILYSGAANIHLRRLVDLQSILNGHVHLFFNHYLIVEMLQLWDWFAVC